MKNQKLRDINRIAVSAAIIAVCSWISVPAPVPFTLQTFGVFLTSGLFGRKKGALAVAVFIFLGAIGIPVFSGGRGGLGVLFGETGGYIIGFLPAAFLCGSICEKKEKSISRLILAMLSGLVVCYASGVLWAYFAYLRQDGLGFIIVLTKHIAAFIIPDLAKIIAAAFAVRALNKRII